MAKKKTMYGAIQEEESAGKDENRIMRPARQQRLREGIRIIIEGRRHYDKTGKRNS